MRALFAAALLSGCTDINQDVLLLPSPSDTAERLDGPDRVLILNGKLSSKEAGYTLNERGADDRWIGPSVHVWDPATPGALTRLGWLDFGPDSVDHDWEIMAAREIAVSPDGTLWGLMVDQGGNDEWILAEISVPDPAARDQPLGVTAYVIHPDDADLYNTDEYTGMGFASDGSISLCSPADGAFPGALFEATPPSGFDGPGEYYAEPGLGGWLKDFPDNLGCAGDVVDGHALVRPGNDFAAHSVWDLTTEGPVAEHATDPAEPLTGLAWANQRLWAVGIEGDVLQIDPAQGTVTLHDDLRPVFPDDDLGQSTRRLRGAAGWTP